MSTFFAYRLPKESKVHYLKGELQSKKKITSIKGDNIVFASFDNKKIVELIDVSNIQKEDFEIFFNSAKINETQKADYLKNYSDIHKKLKSTEFDKVVLSRVKKVKYNKPVTELFTDLNKEYSNTFNYLLSSPELGCWIGATPELLCQIQEGEIKTVSLAGTKKHSEKWSHKEYQEQQFVTDFIIDKMTKTGFKNIQTKGPFNLQAGPVTHLKSEISASLSNSSNWQNLINNLHPTPAVCGIPSEKSQTLINNTENHKRQLYTGFIGVGGKTKHFFVNLRCMQLKQGYAYLYLGGGLTRESQSEKEWEETERKAKTLENILKKI